MTAIAASELWAFARRTAFDATGTKADTEILQLVNDALDLVAMTRRSSYWMKRAFLSLQTPYTTGTIALTNASTTVTLTTGTWPTWAASGRILVNGQILDVATRSSNSVVLLGTAFGGDTDSSSSFVLFQDQYTLPDNMLAFGRILPGQNWGWGGDPVPIDELWEAQNAVAYGLKYPAAFAIYQQYLVMQPYPSENNTVAYTYYARPTPMALSTDSADMDPAQLLIVHRAIEYMVAMRFGKSVSGDAGVCFSNLQTALGLVPTNNRQTQDLPGLLDIGPSHRPPDWRRRNS